MSRAAQLWAAALSIAAALGCGVEPKASASAALGTRAPAAAAPAQDAAFVATTTEVCPLVMPPPPGKSTSAQVDPQDLVMFGTDLGRTYRDRQGRIAMLFGDTWLGVSQNLLSSNACM